MAFNIKQQGLHKQSLSTLIIIGCMYTQYFIHHVIYYYSTYVCFVCSEYQWKEPTGLWQ